MLVVLAQFGVGYSGIQTAGALLNRVGLGDVTDWADRVFAGATVWQYYWILVLALLAMAIAISVHDFFAWKATLPAPSSYLVALVLGIYLDSAATRPWWNLASMLIVIGIVILFVHEWLDLSTAFDALGYIVVFLLSIVLVAIDPVLTILSWLTTDEEPDQRLKTLQRIASVLEKRAKTAGQGTPSTT